MKLPEVSNQVWTTLVGAVSVLLGRTFVVKQLIKFLLNKFAKPFYDFLVRKGALVVEKVKAKKAEDRLENSQTIEDAKKEVDNVP